MTIFLMTGNGFAKRQSKKSGKQNFGGYDALNSQFTSEARMAVLAFISFSCLFL